MREIDIQVKPEVGLDKTNLDQYVKEKYGLEQAFVLLKRSIDARQKQIKVNLRLGLLDNNKDDIGVPQYNYQNVANGKRIIIVGAGPAGYFAALRCLEMGAKPIVLERGKDVQARRRDLAAINKNDIVNPDSNYCFGEGGAGTYSDGKLYTRSKKRGDLNKVLNTLVNHGAREEILYDAHPHIGTNKLPKIIQAIRETIIGCGGEIIFDKRVTDLKIVASKIEGVYTQDGELWTGEAVILATGHSSRDVFEILHKNDVAMFEKPFALGFRIEHQQSLIDSIQYHCDTRGEFLPAAPYSLKTQVKQKQGDRAVFSFCMCPGGFIVPSATAPNELVVNGMSPSKRDGDFANSGMVAAVDQKDFKPFEKFGVFQALMYQKQIEQRAFDKSGGTQKAPAMNLIDFLDSSNEKELLSTSYQPGLYKADFNDIFPRELLSALREGVKVFGKNKRGYVTENAQVIGVESRTSSPIHIPRSRETFEHIKIEGLYPCGEGAGYAGGIVSAAIDGGKCAEKAIEKHVLK